MLNFRIDAEDFENPLGMIKDLQIDNQIPTKVLPFSEDGAGNCLCLDFRVKPKSPSVVYFVHDDGADEPLYWVADSFTEFLDKLFDSEELESSK